MSRKTKFAPKHKAFPSARNFEKIIEKNKSKFAFLAGVEDLTDGFLKLFPAFTNADAIAGLCAGFQRKSANPAPAYVENASKKFWGYLGIDPFADPANASQMGKFAGLVENSPSVNDAIKSKRTEGILNIAHDLSNAAKIDAAIASPEESKQFSDARVDVKKAIEKIRFPAQRVKIYLIICLAWPEIKKLNSTSEFHEWLLAIKDADGKTFIAANTDSREIRKICQSIKLEFPNQWRTAKSETENPGPL